jgi:hypothetical protein
MNRREALFHTAAILGGTITGAQVFLSGCTTQKEPVVGMKEVNTEFLNEVAETILPTTPDSGGAKAAGVGEFMKTIVTDCYDQTEEETFWSGIEEIDQEAERRYSAGFMMLDDDQKFDLIAAIDQEARNTEGHYFRIMKELTLWGYFSSETGCTEAFRFNPTPGRYEACIPYNNEPDWAG